MIHARGRNADPWSVIACTVLGASAGDKLDITPTDVHARRYRKQWRAIKMANVSQGFHIQLAATAVEGPATVRL